MMRIFETLIHRFKQLPITLSLSLVFSILIYVFGVFIIPITSCETGFLTRSVVYGKTYLHSPSINLNRIQSFHEQLHYFLLNSCKKQFNFNIYRYNNLSGLPFQKKHPCNHPNLHLYINIYVEQILNIYTNIQMSHQPYAGFDIFTNYNIRNKPRDQYINNIMSLYDANTTSPILFAEQKFILNYTKINFDKIIEHYKRV